MSDKNLQNQTDKELLGQLMMFLERAKPHLPEDLAEEAQEYREEIHDNR